jgi:hypothetical protein
MRCDCGAYKPQYNGSTGVREVAVQKCIKACSIAPLSFVLVHNTSLCIPKTLPAATLCLRGVFCPKSLTLSIYA